MDDPNTLQLPKMPTAQQAGVGFGAAIRAPAASGLAGLKDAAGAVGNVISQVPAFVTGAAAGLGGATPAAAAPAPAPVATVGGNPYAPGGVVPPVASPEAIAAFHASIADPGAVLARASAANTAAAAPQDPLANQIRFVDQNSPKVAAPVAEPNIIRGGIPSGGGGGITNRDLTALGQFMPPVKSANEDASRQMLDIYSEQHRANLELALAQKNGDPNAIAAAKYHADQMHGDVTSKHLENLIRVINSTVQLTPQAQ